MQKIKIRDMSTILPEEASKILDVELTISEVNSLINGNSIMKDNLYFFINNQNILMVDKIEFEEEEKSQEDVNYLQFLKEEGEIYIESGYVVSFSYFDGECWREQTDFELLNLNSSLPHTLNVYYVDIQQIRQDLDMDVITSIHVKFEDQYGYMIAVRAAGELRFIDQNGDRHSAFTLINPFSEENRKYLKRIDV
jgi:hypothetical protein